jgi:polyhydroxyalkanoate synthesis regulator phasin
MNRIRQTVSVALVLAMLSLGLTAAQAQRRPYRMTDRQVGELIQRVETSADRFRATIDRVLDRGRLNGTSSEDNINNLIRNFENATDQLRDRFNRRVSVASDVELVLQQANLIDGFVLNNRLNQRATSDWTLVRNDLNALASAYGVNWRWNQQTTVGGGTTTGLPYHLGDVQLRQLIRRIETRTDTFRATVDTALDRGRYDGTRAENNVNQFIRDFEAATDQLRDRFNSRNSATGDVENVLRRANYIDDFMRRNNLSRRAQNEWSVLRTDLNELASAYSVAWNWDTNTLPSTGGPVYTASGLTGTYRLDPSRSDNARDVATRATANLPFNQRQRVFDNIMTRLESPDMLAIQRQGMSVTIASSRAPQTTFDADGRERREQLPNGSASRVTARLVGERLTVSSAGDRATDFNVTFEPTDGGRSLLVTREIWNDRLGTGPVFVRNVYNRTSDVAQWNVYGGGSGYPNDTSTINTATGNYIIPNGQTVVATLNTDLSTSRSQVGDRFTMTVREPSQFAGATIEGRVANVSRSGRVTGRADMAFDFDTIRLTNGQTYSFAGFIEGARGMNGETVQVDNEGGVRDDDSRGETTAQRAAIGTAVGAIIGAIAGGGKGAAIGAIVGAGAGAGSVYVQGRGDLELLSGSEVTIRASAPNR